MGTSISRTSVINNNITNKYIMSQINIKITNIIGEDIEWEQL